MKNKGIHIVHIVMLMLVCVLVFYLDDNTNNRGENKLSKDYKLINNELSCRENDDKLKVLYELGKDYPKGSSIVVQTKYQSLEVYVDKEKIYDYSTYLPTKSWHDITIKPNYYGKKIEFIYKNMYGMTHEKINNKFYVGDFVSIILHEIKINCINIVCSMLLFLFGMIFIILSFLQKRKNKDKVVIYLSIFAIVLSMKIFFSIGLLQTIFKMDNLVSILEYELVYIATLFMVLFKKEHFGGIIKKIYRIIVIIVFFNFVIGNMLLVLKCSFNFNIAFNLIQIHMYISIFLLAILAMGAYEYYYNYGNGRKNFIKTSKNLKNKKYLSGYTSEYDKYMQRKKTLKLSVLFVNLTIIIDLCLFAYFTRISHYTEYDGFFIFKIGTVVYMATMSADITEHVKKMVVIGKKTLRLEELARQDSLTKANSRTSYAEFVERINKDKELCYSKMIVSFDVNDLKVINDNYGHDAGDRYLIDCANIIKKAFETMGKCYRIGGDEFIVIIDNYEEEEFKRCKNKLKKELKYCKREYDNKPISIAYGYAKFDEKIDNNILDTVKRADAMMYRRKSKLKQRRLPMTPPVNVL